jgi:hypothetical protein
MQQMTCILQLTKETGAARLFAASNVLGVVQNGPSSWTVEVPEAPEGFEWVAHAQLMTRDLPEDFGVETLADVREIEVATNDTPDETIAVYLAATLTPLESPDSEFADSGDDDDEEDEDSL